MQRQTKDTLDYAEEITRKVSKEKFKIVMTDYITKETFSTEEQRRECPRKRKELDHETYATMIFL